MITHRNYLPLPVPAYGFHFHSPLTESFPCYAVRRHGRVKQIFRLKANLVALGLRSDGTPNDLVGRLLEALLPLPASSEPLAAPTAGVAASDSASRVEQEGSRRSAASDGTEAMAKVSKRGYSALQHRKPLRDVENRGGGVDSVDGEGLLSADGSAAKKQKHSQTPVGDSVDSGHKL